MDIKFDVTGSGFDGLSRTCVQFKAVRGKGKGGKVYRCVEFAPATKAGKHPKACQPRGQRKLISRSRGLIRHRSCTEGTKAVQSKRRRRAR